MILREHAAVLVAGARVFLRHPVREDEGEFLSLRRASRALHVPWEPSPTDGFDPVGTEAFRRFLSAADTDNSQKHLVCRNEDGAIVAYIGLSQIVMGPFCSCYMGYWTGAPHVRRGYASEGVALTLQRAFTELGLHRVEANIIPENVASSRVIARCRFRREGYSPRYLKIAGEWRDHERWAITVEDWREVTKHQ